jgi:hypothetical protein
MTPLHNDQSPAGSPQNKEVVDQGVAFLEEKVEELVRTIQSSAIDSKKARQYQQQIADAFRKASAPSAKFAPFEALNADNSMSREQLLSELEQVLAENEVDSEQSKVFIRQSIIKKGVLLVVSLLLIVTGFAMIIMPAPPSFELFTVFYFNPNDGVTVMDLVSLLIIFGGVFLFVLNFAKK